MDLDKDSIRKAAVGFAAASQVVVFTVSGFAAGYFLDRWLNTNPWFTVLLTLVGFVGGFYQLYKLVMQDEKSDDDSGKGNNSA